MDKKIFTNFLSLQIDDEKKFLIILDWTRREFFTLIKEKMKKIDWKKGNWLKAIECIFDDIIYEWEEIENFFLNYKKFPIKRLKGVLYEILFYLSTLKTSTLFKGSWIMEIAGDPLIPNEEPPWLEIIPIYDILPRTFRIKEKEKWILRAPQIEADFIVGFWDEKGTLPLTFIDVKANLKNYDQKTMVWSALGCKWFYNSILQISIPNTSYPKELKEWSNYQVCWGCGTLNKSTVYCKKCKTKIWLAKDELWKVYPLK